MKKVIDHALLKYGLFAERVFYRFGIEIYPLKWRILEGNLWAEICLEDNSEV